VLTLKGVGLNAELNSLSSGGIFKRRGRDEGVIEQKLGFLSYSTTNACPKKE
jgi:hypothetical protein